MITATKFLTLIFSIYQPDSKASRASQRQSEKSKPTAGAEVKNNTVKYGGKINGNDCKLSVNY